MLKKILSFSLIFVLLLTMSACSFGKKQSTEKKQILTTNYIDYSIVKSLVGDNMDVVLTNNTSSSPDSATLRIIRSSSAIIYKNDELEPWVPNLLEEQFNDFEVLTIQSAEKIKLKDVDFSKNMFTETTTLPADISDTDSTSESDVTNLQEDLFTSKTSESKETTETQTSSQQTQPANDSEFDYIGNYSKDEIREFLHELRIYDTVGTYDPVGELFSKKYNDDLEAMPDVISYTFEGTVYKFGVSRRGYCFVFLGSEKANPYTASPQDNFYWLSFDNLKIIAYNIKEGLVKIDGVDASYIEKKYESLITDINTLSGKYKESVKTDSILIVGGEYIPYTLIEELGIHYASYNQGTKASKADASGYANWLKRNEVSCSLFFISEPCLIDSIASETGLETKAFNSMENVEDIDKSFIEYMNENLEAFKDCIK